MSRSMTGVLLRGALAGASASVPQVIVGKLGDVLLLPQDENADIAPRLVQRVSKLLGMDPSEGEDWLVGTLFHVGYSAGWGAVYAAVAERLRPPPVVGGSLLGGLIYGITFTRWGGAVKTGTERPPERRTGRMTVVAWSVALSFGIATGLIYEEVNRRAAPRASRRSAERAA